MNKSSKNNSIFDIEKNYKIGENANGLDIKKIFELEEIVKETPMDINKINHFMVGQTRDDLKRYSMALAYMTYEKEAINKKIVKTGLMKVEAIRNIRTWKKWDKGSGNFKAIFIVAAAIMIWLSNLAGNVDYSIGLAKAFGVCYLSLFAWCRFLRLAIKGCKDKVNNEIKKCNKLREEFLSCYKLKSLELEDDSSGLRNKFVRTNLE